MNQNDLWNLNLKIFNLGGFVKRMQFGLFKRQTFSALKRNIELVKNENRDKQAHVLALGPSLKRVILSKIEGDTIVVNRFYKFGLSYPSFTPTYYLMIDYGFMRSENRQDFEEALAMYANRGTIFILNSKLAGLSFVEKIPDKQLYFISPFDGRLNPKRDYRIDKWQPAFQNVVGAAILTLMLMGYKNINLFGCDFNSFASTKQTHCYKDKSETRLYPLYEELFAYSFAAKDHNDLQELAKRMGVSIINRTEGSLIDAYPLEIDENFYISKNDENT